MADPHVTIYNETSVDGRIEGFAVHPARYYARGFTLPTDAILMGSVTAQAFGPAESAEERAGPGPPVEPQPVVPGFEHLVREPKPLLVVVDSRGTVANWRHAQAQPWYGGHVALVARSTPPDHLAYLRRRDVDIVVAGDVRVDLAAALREVGERYGVRHVRTDAGGSLNGALLTAGVVDEVVLLVDPVVSGRPGARGVVDLPSGTTDPGEGGFALDLTDLERLDDGALWLRYRVVRR